jgi:hypothetical protein
MSIFCRFEKSGANLAAQSEMAIIKCQPRHAATVAKQNANGNARKKYCAADKIFRANC